MYESITLKDDSVHSRIAFFAFLIENFKMVISWKSLSVLRTPLSAGRASTSRKRRNSGGRGPAGVCPSHPSHVRGSFDRCCQHHEKNLWPSSLMLLLLNLLS